MEMFGLENKQLPPSQRIVLRQISDYIINVGLLADPNSPFFNEFVSLLRESLRQSVATKSKSLFKEVLKRDPTCEEKKELFTTMATFLVDKSAGDPMEGIKVLKVINEEKIKDFVDALWVEPKDCSDSKIAEDYLKALLNATNIVNNEINKWVRENGLEKEYEKLKKRAILVNLTLGERLLTMLASKVGKVQLLEKSLARIRKWKAYYSSH